MKILFTTDASVSCFGWTSRTCGVRCGCCRSLRDSDTVAAANIPIPSTLIATPVIIRVFVDVCVAVADFFGGIHLKTKYYDVKYSTHSCIKKPIFIGFQKRHLCSRDMHEHKSPDESQWRMCFSSFLPCPALREGRDYSRRPSCRVYSSSHPSSGVTIGVYQPQNSPQTQESKVQGSPSSHSEACSGPPKGGL